MKTYFNLSFLIFLKIFYYLFITLGDGTTEKVFIILSGNSSRILETKSVPIPDPVPPPKEWVS